MSFLESLGSRLQEFIYLKSISNQELAEKLGVHVSLISQVLSGDKKLPYEFYLLLCEALGITPELLFSCYSWQYIPSIKVA